MFENGPEYVSVVGWVPWAVGTLCANAVEAEAIRRVATTRILSLVIVISFAVVVTMTTHGGGDSPALRNRVC